MRLLQAIVNNSELVLWAEQATNTGDSGTRKPRKRTRTHPFAASADELATVCAGLVPDWTTDPSSITIWLPTVNARPVPSSPLIEEIPDGTGKLQAWKVPACVLKSGSALDVLASIDASPTLAPGVGVGVTLRYWSVAYRFAVALVTRQQFLPDVVSKSGKWVARWSPVITGNDATHFDQLAKAMPPACRATGDTFPDRPAANVLREFITAVVDNLARGPVPEKPRTTFASIHDRWIHALRSATGVFGGPKADATRLVEQIHEWRHPVTMMTEATFRLCFRLDEPDPLNQQDDWQVHYLLQGRDDPSLHIPAADVWANQTQLSKTDLKPILLAGLGQAARLNANIETSLKQAAPTGFSTTTAGAHQFLIETAWMLEQAGFGVLLPAWWTGHATKHKIEATAKVKSPPMSGGSGLSLENLVEFRWSIAVDDEELTLRELQILAKQKAPLVQFRGKWIQANSAEIQAAIELLKKKAIQTSVQDVMKLALGITTETQNLPTRGAVATGWIETFLQGLTSSQFAELPPPTSLNATMRPYQIRGYSWLAFLRKWRLGACLADDMGLGKTLQTLALLLRDREAGVKHPVLLVCPMSVVGNWSREAARFAPDLPILIHHGPDRARTKATLKKAMSKIGVVITSYGLLARDLTVFESQKWSGIILDEAQTIKNPNTKTAQAARAIPSEYRIALTGTPVENHVGDLWALGQFLNPGLLGTAAAFRRDFFIPIQRHQDVAAAERLKRITGPFLLRRLKTDPTVIRDLPAKIETTEYCTLTREQASLYAAVVNALVKSMRDASDIQRKGLVLGALSKLKQVCNHPAQFLGDRSAIPNRSGKLTRLTQMLEELLEAGEKSLIFTQFTEMGDIIRQHLQDTFGREVLFLHGSVSRKQRDAMVQKFQSAEGPPIFLLSLKAGGTGLNLTAATHVFHYDRWWNPAVETQATDRAFRIGQKRTVQVHPFVCSGTLEERIDEMLTNKRKVAAAVVGTGEGWLTKLDDNELRDVLTLRPDAVED